MSNDSTLSHALPVAGQKHNQYCGPAAMAAITGLNTGECAKIMREVSGKRSIRGLSVQHMIRSLNHVGIAVASVEYEGDPSRPEWERYKDRPTINQWLNEYDESPVILVAGNHYWAISGDRYVDSWNRLPTPVSKIRQPKARVEHALWIMR